MGYALTILDESVSDEEADLWIDVKTMAVLRRCMSYVGMVARGYSWGDIPIDALFDEYMSRVPGHPVQGTEASFEAEAGWYSSPEKRVLGRWRPSCSDAPGETWPKPGIAVHKLCDNGFWFVTPDECREALAAWTVHLCRFRADSGSASRSHLRCLPDPMPADSEHGEHESRQSPDPTAAAIDDLGAAVLGREEQSPVSWLPETWASWLEFLDRAARHGGFQVH